jgi:hypothetical protein
MLLSPPIGVLGLFNVTVIPPELELLIDRFTLKNKRKNTLIIIHHH